MKIQSSSNHPRADTNSGEEIRSFQITLGSWGFWRLNGSMLDNLYEAIWVVFHVFNQVPIYLSCF